MIDLLFAVIVMMNDVELSSCSRFCFLLGRQLLLFVLENYSIIHFIFFALYVFKSHRVALYYSLHHLFGIPRSNGVIVATRVEHMVCKGKRDDSIIMSRKFFDFLHIWPMIDPYFSIIAACIEMLVQKLHSEDPPSQTFNKFSVRKFLHRKPLTSGF